MIQAVPIISEMGSTFIDVATLVDGAGNIFMGIITDGNQNGVDIYKLTPNGTLTLVETVVPGPGGIVGHKVDHADLSHTGSNLVVGMITHDAVSAKPRSIRAELAQVVGVYALRAGQEAEEGGAGAYQPIGEPQEVEVDYERIKSDTQVIVNAALHTIVDNMIPKAKLAIEQEGVLTLGNVHESAGLYARFTETTFEQVDKVMDLRGVGHPIPRNEPSSTATESPRP